MKNYNENQVFQSRLETDYLFTEFKGIHLIGLFGKTKSVLKDIHLNCHYTTAHKQKYEGYARVALTSQIFTSSTKHFYQIQDRNFCTELCSYILIFLLMATCEFEEKPGTHRTLTSVQMRCVKSPIEKRLTKSCTFLQ